MKKNFKAFLNFYELLSDAEEELGIETLTNKDKVILTEIIKLSNKNDNILLNYRNFEKKLSKKQLKISRAQFFKSISNLLERKIIIKIGLKRSGTFKLVT